MAETTAPDAGFQLRFATLDVFTTTRYAGNPLAVVVVPADRRAALAQAAKQRIAREFNLSETVFLHEPAPADAAAADHRDVDIFTTTSELPFAGHPVVGTASLLRLEGAASAVRTLVTRAGPIALSAGAQGIVRAAVPHAVHVHAGRLAALPGAEALVKAGALGHGSEAVLQAELAAPPVSIVRGMTFLLVRLPDLEALARVSPAGPAADLSRVEGLLDEGPWRVSYVGRYYYVVVGDGEGGTALRTRLIAVRTGTADSIFEDPATGSAASALASYLTLQRAEAEVDVPLRYDVVQGVEMGRRSEITVEVVPARTESGEAAVKEVYLSGSAVVVMSGTITVD